MASCGDVSPSSAAPPTRKSGGSRWGRSRWMSLIQAAFPHRHAAVTHATSTLSVTLTPAFIDQVMSDDGRVPTHHALRQPDGSSFPAEAREHDDVVSQLASAFSRLMKKHVSPGHGVVVLGERGTATDVPWALVSNTVECLTLMDVITVLRNSTKLYEDVLRQQKECFPQAKIFLRPFVDFCPSQEIRCFVEHGRLLGACQRAVDVVFPDLAELPTEEHDALFLALDTTVERLLGEISASSSLVTREEKQQEAGPRPTEADEEEVTTTQLVPSTTNAFILDVVVRFGVPTAAVIAILGMDAYDGGQSLDELSGPETEVTGKEDDDDDADDRGRGWSDTTNHVYGIFGSLEGLRRHAADQREGDDDDDDDEDEGTAGHDAAPFQRRRRVFFAQHRDHLRFDVRRLRDAVPADFHS